MKFICPVLKFICPVCRSHLFGTSYPDHKPIASFRTLEEAKNHFDNNAVGYCHGYLEMDSKNVSPCDFEWPRKDDHKYFK